MADNSEHHITLFVRDQKTGGRPTKLTEVSLTNLTTRAPRPRPDAVFKIEEDREKIDMAGAVRVRAARRIPS